MGRKHDGGYAEMALIPGSHVFPVRTHLSWEEFGAVPETYLTAWGTVCEAIKLQPGGSLLIRGGTSAAGLACSSIARDLGCTLLATTRSEDKKGILEEAGVDHILLDDGGSLEQRVKEIIPAGVDGMVEFVGLEKSILDSLQCAAPGGTVCMVGFPGNRWDYQFFPWMPSTVKLTLYSSETLQAETHTGVLQEILKKVESGNYQPHIHRVFPFAELPDAHRIMEKNLAAGKLVVRVD
jgi:NADPH:quinone reductase-like Zn-dependent oxidoreductase